jgi:hypothetical protein
MKRFEQSLDVSEFGELRYIYAQRAAEGGTFFVAFWVEGSFKLADMFPTEGDAPGRDAADVPRPPQARRILSSWEEGRPQAVATYLGGGSTGRLIDFYRDEMPEAGWDILEVDDVRRAELGLPEAPREMLTYEQGERMVSVVVTETAQGPTTSVLTHH